MEHRFKKGKIFYEKKELTDAGYQYALVHQFKLQVRKSDTRRWHVLCKSVQNPPCTFSATAVSKGEGSVWIITVFNEAHGCQSLLHTGDSKVPARVLGNMITDKVTDTPDYTSMELRKDQKRVAGLNLTSKQALRAIGQAKKAIYGSDEEGFADIEKYFSELAKANPGSLTVLDCERFGDNRRFVRGFVAMASSMKGFAYCRPVITIDGCHLKSVYKGVLLAATTLDANNHIFPLAYAVVGCENHDNWTWFFRHLRTALASNIELNFGKLVIVSDRQKGLIAGVNAVFSEAAHGFCLRHLIANFKMHRLGTGRAEATKLIHAASEALTEDDYNGIMARLDAVKPGASQYFKPVVRNAHGDSEEFQGTAAPMYWSEWAFPGKRYGIKTSNTAESFNAWIEKERYLPCLQLFMSVRDTMVAAFEKRRAEHAAAEGNRVDQFALTPKISTELKTTFAKARKWIAAHIENQTFEVKKEGSVTSHTASIDQAQCTCCVWQRLGLPCVHAAAIMLDVRYRLDPRTGVDEYFRLAAWKQTYATPLQPVPPRAEWKLHRFRHERHEVTDDEDDSDSAGEEEGAIIIPPQFPRRTGRPIKRRVRGPDERAKRDTICGLCKRPGHNRVTCDR